MTYNNSTSLFFFYLVKYPLSLIFKSSDIRIDANTEVNFHNLDVMKSKNIVIEKQTSNLTSILAVKKKLNGKKDQKSLPLYYLKR